MSATLNRAAAAKLGFSEVPRVRRRQHRRAFFNLLRQGSGATLRNVALWHLRQARWL